MHTEMPILRRCCCCIPLRGGLLAWGYLKLIITSLMLIYMLWTFIEALAAKYLLDIKGVELTSDTVIGCIIILLILAADEVLHIIFVVGGHKKDAKLLKVYYYYSLTLLVLHFLLGVFGTGVAVGLRLYTVNSGVIFTLICKESVSLIINFLTQAYIVLLVKCEIEKIENTSSFKFLNNAAEAEKYNINIASLAKEKEAAMC